MKRIRISAPKEQGSSLASIGVSSQEEKIYTILLSASQGTLAELAAESDLPVAAVRSHVRELERKGFLTYSPERTRRFIAVPPDVAIEPLLAERQAVLQSEVRQARATLARLREVAASAESLRADDRVVEVLSREAAGRTYVQIVKSAQDEILCLERLPIIVSPLDRPAEEQIDSLARRVRLRTVTDSSLLDVDGTLQRLRAAAASGEQFRIFPMLPFKLVVVDRRTALIPLDVKRPDGAALLVRTSSLLEGLCALFDTYWRVGVPFNERVEGPPAADDVSADAVLPMLASGLNDKMIAYRLNVSHRTLMRRISELMQRHGASNRFQLGWLAARIKGERGDVSP
jgi:sugar-specific transcriptional regulator TrmB